eukprot:gene4771-15075_t
MPITRFRPSDNRAKTPQSPRAPPLSKTSAPHLAKWTPSISSLPTTPTGAPPSVFSQPLPSTNQSDGPKY